MGRVGLFLFEMNVTAVPCYQPAPYAPHGEHTPPDDSVVVDDKNEVFDVQATRGDGRHDENAARCL
jgi:hypothetical protein